MKKLAKCLFIAFLVFTACQPKEDLEPVFNISVFDGVINFNGVQYLIESDKSNLDIRLKRNLILNPYNLFLTIQVDANDVTAPTLLFYSDFDRKINPGDTYRLPVTIKLAGDFEYIAGQTGGRIYFNTIGGYGMELGSELQITVAEEDEFIIDGSNQFLHLKGEFVGISGENAIETKIGDFDITIYGEHLIDLEIF